MATSNAEISAKTILKIEETLGLLLGSIAKAVNTKSDFFCLPECVVVRVRLGRCESGVVLDGVNRDANESGL